MAKQQEKDKKKNFVKRPTAIKRDIQSEKRRLINKSFKNRVRTAVRFFERVVEGKEASSVEALRDVYSLMDKGVKRGIFKQNKANRTKSRLAARLVASS